MAYHELAAMMHRVLDQGQLFKSKVRGCPRLGSSLGPGTRRHSQPLAGHRRGPKLVACALTLALADPHRRR
jgi:hypothetical protein